MTRLKDATFESNALTGTDAFTTTTGSPTIDGTSLIHGTYCFRTNWASATNMNGTVSGLSATEIWISFYIRVATLPSTGAPRIVTTSNGNTQFNMTINSSGVLSARNNTTGLASIRTLSVNTTYRIGLHLKVSTGAANADAVYEVFSAVGDAVFGTADLSVSNQVMNVNNNAFSSVVLGMNNGVATTGDIYWDSLRIDNASMPASDGATNTPMTVSVTVTDTIVSLKNVGKPITVTVTDTVAILKNIGKPVTVTITDTVATPLKNVGKSIAVTVTDTVSSVLKNIGKAIGVTVTGSSVITRDILKALSVTESTTVTVARNIANVVSLTVVASSVVEMLRGKIILASVTVSSTITRQMDIDKIVSYTQAISVSANRLLTLSIESIVNVASVINVGKQISLTKSVVVTVISAFSKAIANTLSSLFFRKNIGALELGSRNKTVAVVGKNTRTINLQDTDES